MATFIVTQDSDTKVVHLAGTQADVNTYAAANAGTTAVVGAVDLGDNKDLDASGNWFYHNVNGVYLHRFPADDVASTREKNRAEIYQALALNSVRVPAINAKDEPEATLLNTLIRKVAACAGEDHNMDDAARITALLETARYDFRQYIIDWTVSSGSTVASWNPYLAEGGVSLGAFAKPNASGVATADANVRVPSGWATFKFEPVVYPYLPEPY